ncbi:M48 family metalloprotease, partial [Novosphingobium sp.]|uniref:M48 family metalloprotease n=1 Tax=Novosphingobium sp. TaxID=1874826 RepID=UPI0025D44915
HSDARAKITQRNVLLGALGQAVLGGLLGNGTLGQVGQQLGQTGIQRLVVGNVMSHSRKDEFEADDLGTVYMARAGYPTGAAATVLASLAAQTDLEQRESGNTRTTPGWALSHPEPGARVARLLQRARAAGAAAPAAQRNSAAFLPALDGMLVEDDPHQGVIEGQTFLFPDDRIKFTAPAGYGMSNGAEAVTISAISGGSGQATFTGGTYDGNLKAVLARAIAAISDGKGTVPSDPTSNTINGMQALSTSASAQDSSGNAFDVTFYAIARSPAKAYSFTLIQPAGRGAGDLVPLVESFTAMTAAQAAAVRPRVIRVVTIKSGDTVTALAAKMAYPKQAREHFLVLNGLPAGTERLASGSRVKLVVYGPQGR